MASYTGIINIMIGGQERPLKFGTNQTDTFCSLRGIDLPDYPKYLQKIEQDLGMFRDLLYSALRAGARSEKQPVNFDNETVGDWMDSAMEDGSFDAITAQFTKAFIGEENPNAKAQAKPAKLQKA